MSGLTKSSARLALDTVLRMKTERRHAAPVGRQTHDPDVQLFPLPRHLPGSYQRHGRCGQPDAIVPGKDYRLIAVSFDPTDTPRGAKKRPII